MHGVGVYDESAGELVGADVVARERAAENFRGVLRMLRENIGERSSHKTMVATKRSLQTLLLLSLVHSTEALSLTSPTSFSVLEQLQLHGLSCWMVSIVILFFMFASLLIAMPPRHSMLEEPEPEGTSGSAAVSSNSPAPKYNKAAVYCFLCICFKHSLRLIDEAEAEDDSAKTSALHAIYEVFMDLFCAFERDGISPANLQSMKDMHGALNVHDPDFNASDFMTIELDNGFTMSTPEPEIESLLPPDPPDDFFAEEMVPPFEPRSPEHMAMWMIQRLTEKLRFEMESGNPEGVLKHGELVPILQRKTRAEIGSMENDARPRRHFQWWWSRRLIHVATLQFEIAHDQRPVQRRGEKHFSDVTAGRACVVSVLIWRIGIGITHVCSHLHVFASLAKWLWSSAESVDIEGVLRSRKNKDSFSR